MEKEDFPVLAIMILRHQLLHYFCISAWILDISVYGAMHPHFKSHPARSVAKRQTAVLPSLLLLMIAK